MSGVVHGFVTTSIKREAVDAPEDRGGTDEKFQEVGEGGDGGDNDDYDDDEILTGIKRNAGDTHNGQEVSGEVDDGDGGLGNNKNKILTGIW